MVVNQQYHHFKTNFKRDIEDLEEDDVPLRKGDIIKLIINQMKECKTCVKLNRVKDDFQMMNNTKHYTANEPNQIWAMDLLSFKNYDFSVLLTVDTFTRYVILTRIVNKTSEGIADAFLFQLFEYGFPKAIATNRKFNTKILKEIKQRFLVKHYLTTSYSPNKLAERKVQSVKELFKKIITIEFKCRTTIRIYPIHIKYKTKEHIKNIFEFQKRVYPFIAERIAKTNQQNDDREQVYDGLVHKSVRSGIILNDNHQLPPRTIVYYKRIGDVEGSYDKLNIKYEGPAKIIKQDREYYIIEEERKYVIMTLQESNMAVEYRLREDIYKTLTTH
eukprot:gene7504-11827_t